MKVEKIEKLKNGKYKIHLQNGNSFTTYDEIILKNNFLYHKEIDEEEYHNIINETSKYDIKSKIIQMISKKFRSKKEIIEYLNQSGIDNQKEIIEYLEKSHYIDDNRFASAYINDRILLSTDGPNKIVKYLQKHDISEDIIYDKMKAIDDEVWREKIKKIIKKRKNMNTSGYLQKQKLWTDLNNKGYPTDIISEELNKITFSSEGIEKEYEKLKRKLKKKYQGSELEFQIKKKLYQRGYTSSDMDDYLS